MNTSTGNFLENEVDLAFAGPAAALGFTRCYSSLNTDTGGFGPGWSSWTECGIGFTDDAARLRLPDGRVVVFPRLGGGWDRATGESLWLTRNESGGLVMRSASGLVWEFDGSGRLLTTSSGDGTRVELGYDGSGRLARLAHELGRWIEVVWDETLPRVAAIVAGDGRRVDYGYDGAGRLSSAAVGSAMRQYRWNEAGLIEAVIDADGVVEAENCYDETGRVTSQRSQFGRLTRFAYLPGGVTVASDADGGRANTWIADSHGRLVGVIDADDRRQSTSYDRWGNPVMVTERDGAVTVTEYDARGRTRAQVVPSGARLAWVYDDADRPVEVTVTLDDTQQAITRYSYDGGCRNPSVAVDPAGGVTRMAWERGLLKEVVDPTGVRVRFDHDEHGELIASTDAEGNTARLERDPAGRVVAAITPLGHRTAYRYDEAGLLVSRTDPDGARWTYEHTSGGRIRAVIDPIGGRTEIEHGAHGERERVTDPLGRQVGTTYDDLGNLAAVELPDGTRWRFGYDASSRLAEATDGSGGGWRLSYGPNGRVTGAVDPTGVRRTVRSGPLGLPTRFDDGDESVSADYDRLGRTLSVTGPDGLPTLNRYDLCGRLVETVDPAGGVTRVERDPAGRPVAITQPLGGVFRYEYDRCGRWVATISTGGDRYGLGYDSDGRVVAETWPTGERVSTRLDECGRVIERTEPGRGTTRFRYDKAGRIVGVQEDPWTGSRRFVYDLGGQLVEAINALGGVTSYSYDDLGRQVGVTDPAGGVTTRTYDGLNRLLSETDQLGPYDDLLLRRWCTRRRDATGVELCWRYHMSGRLAETLAGDRVLSRVERDFARRTLRVTEDDTVHELGWDPRRNLLHRLRDGVGVRYTYDADGRRTSLTRPDGTATAYSYDANNRLAALEHPGLGRAELGRDALGRITSLAADGLRGEWTYADGYVVARETDRRGFLSSTRLERDADGRVVADTTDGVRTSYAYDAAGQLTGTQTSEGASSRFRWDANGRLAAEVSNGRTTSYRYDEAGQLLAVTGESGRIEYGYDAAGRRTRSVGAGGEQLFGWDPRGFLARVTEVVREGDRRVVRSRDLRVDALGELASIDSASVWWDTAAGVPSLGQVGPTAVVGAGIGTALAGPGGVAWALPGDGGGSPWAPPEALGEVGAAGFPAEVSVSGLGGLRLGGLDWLEARVYDPVTRGFLSTDPLRAVTGAAWSGNPYSFAGNDPVNFSDPLGLRPVTDAELQGYRDANRGVLGAAAAAAGEWWSKNWEYVAAGALIVGGVAVMCTGIGGPIGAAMIAGALTGAGGSIWSQKSATGSVDWGRVAVDGAVGAVTGLIGGGAGAAAARATSGMASCLGRNILTGAVQGGVDGGAGGGLSYLTSGRPVTVRGLLSATADGAGSGATLGGAGGALSKVSGVARYGCFTAETPVLMADGTAKPIAEVEVGDRVAAYNPETGETESRRVADTFVHRDVATLRVTTTAGEITSTINHPFYVEGKGWRRVGDLQAGDRLRTPDGQPVEVVSIEATGSTQTVHNLQVEDLHNYHVVTADGPAILIHNDGACRTGEDLHAFGNASGPRSPRAGLDYMLDDQGLVIPQGGRLPHGASTFADPEQSGLSGGFIIACRKALSCLAEWA